MGCWKWFDSFLKEAGIEVTDENRDEVNGIIHQFIGEQVNYGQCSTDWRKVRKEIQADERTKQKLIKKLRLLYLKWIRYKDF